jgi:RHS repeat-associated protein
MVLTVRQDSHRLSHVLHRSAADLTAIANSTPDGFTGHAMLDGVGLIHMAGRVYDPTVGRFLSVDPLVRDAAASQSWNGYGYVEGRVLSATDPSGWQTVDCPQCVRYRADPRRSAMEVVVVTARRWDPLSINLDRLGLLDLSRGLSRAEMPSQTVKEGGKKEPQSQSLPDQARDSLCSGPAISYGLQLQFDLGLGGLGWQASFAASYTTHGQFLFQAQGGALYGLHAGAAVSLSPQVGAIGADPQRGWSEQSVFVAQVMTVSGPASAGYSLQAGGGSGQIGVEHGRVRLGPSPSAGALVSASVGRHQGKQYASAGMCGQVGGG